MISPSPPSELKSQRPPPAVSPTEGSAQYAAAQESAVAYAPAQAPAGDYAAAGWMSRNYTNSLSLSRNYSNDVKREPLAFPHSSVDMPMQGEAVALDEPIQWQQPGRDRMEREDRLAVM